MGRLPVRSEMGVSKLNYSSGLVVITDLGDSCAQVDRAFDRLLGKADEYFVKVFGERGNISPGLSMAILIHLPMICISCPIEMRKSTAATSGARY